MFNLAVSLLPNLGSLAGSTSSATSGLGALGSGLAATGVGTNLTDILIIAPFAIIVVVIVFFIANRKPNKNKDATNKAIIYSMHHNAGLYTYPFSIERKTDDLGNVTATLAHITKPTKSSLKDSLKRIMDSIRGIKRPDEEKGIPFSEKLAILMEGKYWIAAFTLETNSQIPVIPHFSPEDKIGIQAKKNVKYLLKENPAFAGSENKKYLYDAYKAVDSMPSYQPINSLIDSTAEMELNLERRVSRIKAAQIAIQNYVQNAAPARELGGILLISAILIFIAILVLAFVLNGTGNVIKSSATVIGQAAQMIQNLKYLTGNAINSSV